MTAGDALIDAECPTEAQPVPYGAGVTVAVVVKVFDGIVLATDSATTFSLAGGGAQVYNNANKIFQLHRKRPVAAMTWGLGNIGSASISTLAKDLRRRLMGRDPDFLDWDLQGGYTVEGITNRLVEMFYDDLYATEYPDADATSPELGMLVAGYSDGAKQAEAWVVIIGGDTRPTPQLVIPFDSAGWLAYAQPEATERLFLGLDRDLRMKLQGALTDEEWKKIEEHVGGAQRSPVPAPMPFGDAIALARFLVDVTIGYSHYLLGPDTVGGPVEAAGINRHEGFKWIDRKHYYPTELNPEEPHHA